MEKDVYSCLMLSANTTTTTITSTYQGHVQETSVPPL